MIIFHEIFIEVLRKAATQTSVRNSGWFWNSTREFLNHCHAFPKSLSCISQALHLHNKHFSGCTKTPGAQGPTFSLQEQPESKHPRGLGEEQVCGYIRTRIRALRVHPSISSLRTGWAPSEQQEGATLLLIIRQKVMAEHNKKVCATITHLKAVPVNVPVPLRCSLWTLIYLLVTIKRAIMTWPLSKYIDLPDLAFHSHPFINCLKASRATQHTGSRIPILHTLGVPNSKNAIFKEPVRIPEPIRQFFQLLCTS